MSEWLRIAFSGPVVRRGCAYAVVVGVILIAINHGDVILSGGLTGAVYLKMALTVAVPYCVSVLSSVSAVFDVRDRTPGIGVPVETTDD